MLSERNRILVESIKRLLRRKASVNLQKIVDKTHAADLAVVFRYLSLTDQQKLLDTVNDVKQKGYVLCELDEDIWVAIAENLEADKIVEILEQMPADEAAFLLNALPEEKTAFFLNKMAKAEAKEAQKLLQFEDDTAGSIMVTDYVALKADTTADEAIASLRNEHSGVEMPFYIYVVDETLKLLGVCSLRQLVVMASNAPLKDFMTKDIIYVRTDTDQEEVARMVSRYDILAVPVVDENKILKGIVTIDDVVDILRQEATEDMLKMAGAGEEFIETKSVLTSIKTRMPWLFASCIGGILASYVIGSFSGSLTKYAFLAAFIPVIMGMGGNIGIQSSTIVVRGLATGRILISDLWKVMVKEVTVGLSLGCTYGILLASVAGFRSSKMMLSLAVGLAILTSMTLAALSGSLVPIIFAKLEKDPAVATGPFVTTAIDVISVFCYFHIATALLGL